MRYDFDNGAADKLSEFSGKSRAQNFLPPKSIQWEVFEVIAVHIFSRLPGPMLNFNSAFSHQSR